MEGGLVFIGFGLLCIALVSSGTVAGIPNDSDWMNYCNRLV